MANLTFFEKGDDYYQSLLNIAEEATEKRNFDAARKAINDFENALNECIEKMKETFDLFWTCSNELNDVIRDLAMTAGKEDKNLQAKEELLTAEVNDLKNYLEKCKPQLIVAKYQEKVEILKVKLNKRFPDKIDVTFNGEDVEFIKSK
jgi:hypothetical protein